MALCIIVEARIVPEEEAPQPGTHPMEINTRRNHFGAAVSNARSIGADFAEMILRENPSTARMIFIHPTKEVQT